MPTATQVGQTNATTGVAVYQPGGSTDVDTDDVTYTATSNNGTVTRDANGNFVYTPTDPAANDTITFVANDGHGGYTSTTVTYTALTPNTAPTVTNNGTPTTNASTGVVSGSVTGSDLDGDDLIYTATTDGTKGTVSINPDGTWTYTPTAAARHNAAATNAAPGVKTDTVTITVSDGRGGTDTQTVNVDLTPQLDPSSAGATPVAQTSPGSVFDVSDDGRYVYTVARATTVGGSDTLQINDTTTNQVRTIDVPANSQQPIVTADGKTVYLTNAGGNVYAVDTETGDVTTIVIDGPTGFGTLSSDGTRLYVTNQTIGSQVQNTGRIKVINTATNTVIEGETIETGRFVPDNGHDIAGRPLSVRHRTRLPHRQLGMSSTRSR